MMAAVRANELQAAGHDVIHLEIGEPISPRPSRSSRPVRRRYAGKTRHGARGLPELREAISL
jgi:aspartate/methionine/tyrosine aminotransferase